jgi:transcriptional regulator with XRE-family HTH domain
MLSIAMFHKIRKLKSLGMSQASIARKIQVNSKTIAKYVHSDTPPRYRPRSVSTRVDLFLEFQKKVKKWISQNPKLKDQEIYELLLEEGYQGSRRTVNRRMKELR